MTRHAYMGVGFATLYKGAHIRRTVEPARGGRFQVRRFIAHGRTHPYPWLHDSGMIRVVTVDGVPWETPAPRPPVELFSDLSLTELLIHTPASRPIIITKEITLEITNEGPGDTFAIGMYGFWTPDNPCECYGAKLSSWGDAYRQTLPPGA